MENIFSFLENYLIYFCYLLIYLPSLILVKKLAPLNELVGPLLKV